MGSLLVDRHRPTSLAGLHYHQALSDRLAALVSTDFPHTLFYGPSGAGKKTRIMCVLKELFGPGVEKVRRRDASDPTRARALTASADSYRATRVRDALEAQDRSQHRPVELSY